MLGRRVVEIFTGQDASVEPIPDLASAAYKIRMLHPRGADFILIGMAQVQGMKIEQDSWGFVRVLIGLRPSTLEKVSGDDEVLVAFDHGALRPAGVIGFLWDADGQDARPPESSSTFIRSRLDGIRQLRRSRLAG